MFNYWAEFYVSTNTKNPVHNYFCAFENAYSLKNHTVMAKCGRDTYECKLSYELSSPCSISTSSNKTWLSFAAREFDRLQKKIQQHQNRLTQLNSLELFFVPVWFWEWFCGFSVGHSLHFIHHLLKVNEVTAFDRNDWNISHSSELTAVVQMLVLETKEIPDKTTTTIIIIHCTNRAARTVREFCVRTGKLREERGWFWWFREGWSQLHQQSPWWPTLTAGRSPQLLLCSNKSATIKVHSPKFIIIDGRKRWHSTTMS